MPQDLAGGARSLRGAAAVLLSLAGHAALLLLLAALPVRRARPALLIGDTKVGVEACTLSLAPLPGPHPRPGRPDGGVTMREPPEYEVGVPLPAYAQPAPLPPPAVTRAPGPSPGSRAAAAPFPCPTGNASGHGNGNGMGTGAGPGLFPVPPGARSVVYVLDRSVSMGLHGALRLARAEIVASLGRLAADTRVQVVPYNHCAEPLPIKGRLDLVTLDTAAREEVARALAALQPSGGSGHLNALRRALVLRPDVLYLVTDGAELSAAEVLAVTQFNQGRTAIHAVELGRRGRPVEDPLRRLAESNRGTYRCVAPGE